ncbi:response regulator [Caldimonas brevitalea]|uniref:Chemotaxis protein CheY n=1 Tax=Caldimonas brevitalea TaxID=413882 RepID=A0A0G3BP49_9BURK|nr:response regulator [Caldimonas brevitalea]AKJ29141.1 chemotaxis protein CheY [Caldimonas brevitalea]
MDEARALHILLVDDDTIDVMNVQRAFAKAQLPHPLHLASNGVEALAMLRGGQVPPGRRLVLLDLNMPCMNGIEFLHELRADPSLRSLPVVVLTTSDDDRDKVSANHLNVAGYLLKPVGLAAFVDLMAGVERGWATTELP